LIVHLAIPYRPSADAEESCSQPEHAQSWL
jgi:hypothetical protein